MSKIGFYFDEMMNRTAAKELIRRNYEVVMANDVGMTQQDDDEHLRYAAERNLVFVTLDKPFAGRIASRSDHAGLICWTSHQDIGSIVRVRASSRINTRRSRLLDGFSG